MSVTRKAAVFIVLTLILGWPALILGWIAGHRDVYSVGIGALIYALSPAAAALISCCAFERGQIRRALGMRFQPNWWWLCAVVIALGVTAISIAITALLSPYPVQDIEGVARQMADFRHEEYSDAQSYLFRSAGYIGLAVVTNTLFSTLTEELGWRGYLHHLWRPFGFWRASAGIGLVWGIWHWPMIYCFGLNYPDDRLLGLAIFPFLTMLEAPVMTFLRDRGQSVWAAGIFHGAINTVLIVTMFTFRGAKFPWNTAGLGTIVAFAIVTAIIAFVTCSQNTEEKNSF